jgi:hypothetical protein
MVIHPAHQPSIENFGRRIKFIDAVAAQDSLADDSVWHFSALARLRGGRRSSGFQLLNCDLHAWVKI